MGKEEVPAYQRECWPKRCVESGGTDNHIVFELVSVASEYALLRDSLDVVPSQLYVVCLNKRLSSASSFVKREQE